ncbi:DUF983 domain-containing protein [Niveispirillum irakense]|uniref:DUF983 domain-containing protein n=1 Tax=Niveispirillum irakense TaxID=34011 RepID=UPI0004114840|nr:DUF983 domain-containing protein [Niveispirillum irakense]
MERKLSDFADTPMGLGARGLCPACGEGHIFNGYLRLAKQCNVCGLDFSFADPADGPAFFTMSIVSIPLVCFAIWLEMAYQAPLWVHLLTTLPLSVVSCLGLLRPLKGWLVCSQYMNKAEQARLDTEENADNQSIQSAGTVKGTGNAE